MRYVVLLLIVANVLLFAWNRGWIGGGATVSDSAREPERLARQIAADRVQVVADVAGAAAEPAATSASAVPASASAAASEPLAAACLEAGPFDAASLEAAERSLGALPLGTWQRVPAGDAVMLRLDAVDGAVRDQVQGLDPAVLAGGFRPCAPR
jgi:hypothetical protein